VNIAQRTRQQRRCPVRVSIGRRLIEHREDALLLGRTVFGCGTPMAGLVETCETSARVAHPPLRGRSGGAAHDPTDLAGCHAFGGQQHDPSAVAHPNFGLRRTAQRLKHRPFLGSQSDRGRARNGSHPQLESRLVVQR